MTAAKNKDTIYVDAEDDITAIIDKLEASPHKIVALVLPKRTNTLKSIVNMRLLKGTADSSKKNLVLITSEASLLPLAGIAGIHVAKSLQSKPAIPAAPDQAAPDEVSDVDDAAAEETPEPDPPKETYVDKGAPIGALTAAAVAAKAADDKDTETIDLDDDDAADGDAKDEAAKEPKPKKDKKLAIPDFDRFRLLMVLGALGIVALIVFLFLATKVLPKATVTITTDSTPVTTNVQATTAGQAKTLDEANKILPSEVKTFKQSNTDKVTATGSKDLGAKATGAVTIYMKDCSHDIVTISAGTGVSYNNLTYITQQSVTLQRVLSGTDCNLDKFSDFWSASVNVVAQNPGTQYNLPKNTTFVVSGFSYLAANNSAAIDGGTSRVVKVVAQADVDAVKKKIADKNTNTNDDFKKQLADSGLYAFEETSTTSEPKLTTSPNVGEEGAEVTVTEEVTYSVLTVKKDDLEKIVKADLEKQIDKSKQKLQDGDVLDKATVRVTDKKSDTDATITVHKDTAAVPIIDNNEIKKAVAGKKTGDVSDELTKRPGIKQVDVNLSPFWVSKVPTSASKIKVITQPAGQSGGG